MQLIFGATVADTDTDTDAVLNSWKRRFVLKALIVMIRYLMVSSLAVAVSEKNPIWDI